MVGSWQFKGMPGESLDSPAYFQHPLSPGGQGTNRRGNGQGCAASEAWNETTSCYQCGDTRHRSASEWLPVLSPGELALQTLTESSVTIFRRPVKSLLRTEGCGFHATVK